MNLLNQVRVLRCLDAKTSGGNITTTGKAVDTKGFEGVLFIAQGSTLLNKAAVYMSCKTAATTTATFMAANTRSTGILCTSGLLDSKTFCYDIYRPLKRYVKPIVVGASSGHIFSITAILYGARRPGSSALESTQSKFRYSAVAATS